MKPRSYFSGFGSAVDNHEQSLKPKYPNAQPQPTENIPTSFNDPRFVSMTAQIKRNQSPINKKAPASTEANLSDHE